MTTATQTADATTPRLAHVHIDSWAGRSKHPCEVLGECVRRGKRHCRVRMLDTAFRWSAGQVRYPPVASVTFPA